MHQLFGGFVEALLLSLDSLLIAVKMEQGRIGREADTIADKESGYTANVDIEVSGQAAFKCVGCTTQNKLIFTGTVERFHLGQVFRVSHQSHDATDQEDQEVDGVDDQHFLFLGELSEMHEGAGDHEHTAENSQVGDCHEPYVKMIVHPQCYFRQTLAKDSSVRENMNEKQLTELFIANTARPKHAEARAMSKTVIIRNKLTLAQSYLHLLLSSLYWLGSPIASWVTPRPGLAQDSKDSWLFMGWGTHKQGLQQTISLYNCYCVYYSEQTRMIAGDIKKMSFSYPRCPNGDLHTGEIMSLVCVDAKCQKRGLICPICRALNHDDHEVLPLKIFIDEVRKLFVQSEDAQSLNNLSDYLRSIDESKKQLLGQLRSTAESIAAEIKKVEQKIQQNYIAIRKNVLAQSTVSTKLPLFLQSLLSKKQNDPHWLQQQFQRYGELIKFENSVMKISDKAKKIVEDYSQLPQQIKFVFQEQVEAIRNGFKNLFSQKTKPAKKVDSNLFSPEDKHHEIKISDDKKEIYTPETLNDLGIAYIKSQKPAGNKKATFRIKSANSGAIELGVGLLDRDKQLAFIFNEPIPNQHFTINSTGYSSLDENEIDDAGNPHHFTFNDVGTEVSVAMDLGKNQVTFTKVSTSENHTLSIASLDEESKNNLHFCVSIGESDRVEVVE